jgi:hypothetical protein
MLLSAGYSLAYSHVAMYYAPFSCIMETVNNETDRMEQDYRIQIAGRIPWLKKLDGTPIDDDEREQGKALVGG